MTRRRRAAASLVLAGVICLAPGFLRQAQAAGLKLRLQAGFLQPPGGTPGACALQESWGSFLIKILSNGEPASVLARVVQPLETGASECFFEVGPFTVPDGSYRIVASDGALVLTCEVNVSGAFPPAFMNVIFNATTGQCSSSSQTTD
ncbi:MAG: hypothetical protein AB7Q29_17620 [Vicinamibacterales bacterium]